MQKWLLLILDKVDFKERRKLKEQSGSVCIFVLHGKE